MMNRRDFIKNASVAGGGLMLAGAIPANVMAVNKKSLSAGYKVKSKNVKYDSSWDVIVAGGGPSGCTAAIAAAREGAKTLIIESMGALGGMSTLGFVPTWCPFTDKEKIIYKGLAEKIFFESKKGVPHVPASFNDWTPINVEYLKRVYDKFIADAGVQVMFYSRVADVYKNAEDEIDALLVANKNGLTVYKAKVYIDCTGDGDVAAWAGAEFQQGNDSGKAQSATHCFLVGNVDTHNYNNVLRKNWQAYLKMTDERIVQSEKYPLLTDNHFNSTLVAPSIVQFNAGHINNIDATNPADVSRSAFEGRVLAEEITRAFRESFPETYGNAILLATAPLIGIREGRRITGDYIFTVEDWLARRSFEDEIGRNCYYIDVHIEGSKKYPRYEKGESHGIPYRILTPKSMKNLLTAGRCISTDAVTYGSLRVMPVCLVSGEAAGMAAAHAITQSKNDVHKIDVQYLRKRLKEEGQDIR